MLTLNKPKKDYKVLQIKHEIETILCKLKMMKVNKETN